MNNGSNDASVQPAKGVLIVRLIALTSRNQFAEVPTLWTCPFGVSAICASVGNNNIARRLLAGRFFRI